MEKQMNKEIYSENTIKKAVTDYKDYARISVSESDKYWDIDFSDFKYDGEQTVSEFENYLIGLENADM